MQANPYQQMAALDRKYKNTHLATRTRASASTTTSTPAGAPSTSATTTTPPQGPAPVYVAQAEYARQARELSYLTTLSYKPQPAVGAQSDDIPSYEAALSQTGVYARSGAGSSTSKLPFVPPGGGKGGAGAGAGSKRLKAHESGRDATCPNSGETTGKRKLKALLHRLSTASSSGSE